MEHPYKKYESSKNWEIIEKAINDLIENQDIDLTTRPEYVIGYICDKIETSKTN